MPKLALAWCLNNPNVSTVILGASREEHLLENLDAVETLDKLDAQALGRIEDILDNQPEHPPF